MTDDRVRIDLADERRASKGRHPASRGPLLAKGRHPSTRGVRRPVPGDTQARPASKRKKKAPAVSTSYVVLLAIVVVLDIIGLVMVLSASSVEALRNHGSAWQFFAKQVMWLAAGSTVMVVVMRIDYRRWRKLAAPLFLGSAFLLLLVLVPGVGINVSGSTRWLGTGSWRMQPSELAKLGVLLFCADLLARRSGKMGDWRMTLLPPLAAFGLIGMLVMLQPDMGTTLVTGCIVLAVLWVAGTRLSSMTTLLGITALGAFIVGWAEPYRRARMLSFIDPWKDAGNTGYQAAQGLVALGSGGWFGVGLGASRAKWGFLPNAHTDFIFAIIGEELGLVGALLVVGLFVAFAALGVRSAVRAPDRFGTLLAAGITAWIVGQAFINIGAVIGLVPITGVPLPFVSFGGSALVITMAAVGMLLNVARQARPVTPPTS
ncbi:MAG TPA: putative lipid II flippase FtsW [Acidimicrobiales bacterium]|nr:putative lipid II flippase FtsW [Acidimicrobiales bacterium]